MKPTIALVPGNADPATAFASIDTHLDAVRDAVDLPVVELGPAAYRRDGVPLTDQALATLTGAHAIVMAKPPNPGPEDTDIAPGVLEQGVVFALRARLRLAINVRSFRGAGPDAGVDITVVRENSEGAYFSPGDLLHAGSAEEAAVQAVLTTRAAAERCLRYGFVLAADRGVPLVLAHKVRVLTQSGGVWVRAAERLAAEFPQVPWRLESIDTACGRLVADPSPYDVIVTDNVFGDILADVASARLGAGEYSVSAEYAAGAGPSLFEPMHDTHSSPEEHEALKHLGLAAAFGAALQHVGLTEQGLEIQRSVDLEVEQHRGPLRASAAQPGDGPASTAHPSS